MKAWWNIKFGKLLCPPRKQNRDVPLDGVAISWLDWLYQDGVKYFGDFEGKKILVSRNLKMERFLDKKVTTASN